MAQRGHLAAFMAAVFALVFLPALAAVGFFLRSAGSLTFGTGLAMVCFFAMTAGVFYGALRMSWHWDHDAAD